MLLYYSFSFIKYIKHLRAELENSIHAYKVNASIFLFVSDGLVAHWRWAYYLQRREQHHNPWGDLKLLHHSNYNISTHVSQARIIQYNDVFNWEK